MGHAIQYFSTANKKAILSICEEYASVNVDRQENPSGSYHGDMHIREDVDIQPDFEAACNKIDSIAADRSYYDVAVRYYDTSKLSKTKKIENLEKRVQDLCVKKNEYVKNHSVKTQKAAFIGCKKCNSKIAKNYLQGEYCPVCRTDLRSKTVLDRLLKFDQDMSALKKQITEEKRKKRTSCPVKWAFKVEVHC